MMKFTKDKKMKKSIALMLIGVTYITSMYSVRALSRKVDVNVDNSTISTMTLNSDTDRILSQVGVKLGANDSVERHDEIDGSLKLDVKRAFEVHVFQNDKKVTLKKSSGTVKDVLDELDISEEERKNVNFSESQELYPGMDIVIGKKVKIVVNVDGKTEECFVPEGSVKDALNYLGIELSPDDVVSVDMGTDVSDDMELTVNRITYREVKKLEDIPFTTETKTSNLLNNCEHRVSRPGKKGTKEVVVREKLKDGEVVESTEIHSKILFHPINEIVINGTNTAATNKSVSKASVPSVASKPKVTNIQNKGTRCVSGSATAYTASAGAKTSTGSTPVEGVTVAVNPKLIPYGSKVRVETNDGKVLFRGIAQDTGGALRKGSAVVDIYMSSTRKCLQFGRKNVKVYY